MEIKEINLSELMSCVLHARINMEFYTWAYAEQVLLQNGWMQLLLAFWRLGYTHRYVQGASPTEKQYSHKYQHVLCVSEIGF